MWSAERAAVVVETYTKKSRTHDDKRHSFDLNQPFSQRFVLQAIYLCVYVHVRALMFQWMRRHTYKQQIFCA